MTDTRLKDLFKKYLDESITPEEFSQLYEMIRAGYDPESIDELLKTTFSDPGFAVNPEEYDRDEVFASLLATIEKKEAKKPMLSPEPAPAPVIPLYRKWRIATAAAVILLMAGSIYYLSRRQPSPDHPISQKKPTPFDAPPGHSGAILTLADGKHIRLDEAQNGSLTQQGNTSLVKQGGQLSYSAKDASSAAAPTASPNNRSNAPEVLYNTVTTPRGREFELVLADGTRVSLNAASTIRFPTTFTGKERRVEVSGEAYFEVTHNENMPFVVQVNSTEIAVLGTHFDVADYNDENNVSATLLEGSVKVSNGPQNTLLAPGEQARLDRTTSVLSRKKVNVEEVVAWTKGRLSFNNSDLPRLMRQISRWYDVDVIFGGNIPNVRIGGFLHRDVNLSTILDYLADNGVHYRTEGKTITILP